MNNKDRTTLLTSHTSEGINRVTTHCRERDKVGRQNLKATNIT